MKEIILDWREIKKVVAYYSDIELNSYRVKVIPEKKLFFGLIKFKKKLIISYRGVWKDIYKGEEVDEVLESKEIFSPINDKGHIKLLDTGEYVFMVHPHLNIYYKDHDVIDSTIFDTEENLKSIVENLLTKSDNFIVISVEDE